MLGNTAEVQMRSAAWPDPPTGCDDNTGLIHDEANALRLQSEKLFDAGPRLVPHASLTQAKLVSDWTIFLIAIDDESDDEDLGPRPGWRRALPLAVAGDGKPGIRKRRRLPPHVAGQPTPGVQFPSRSRLHRVFATLRSRLAGMA